MGCDNGCMQELVEMGHNMTKLTCQTTEVILQDSEKQSICCCLRCVSDADSLL